MIDLFFILYGRGRLVVVLFEVDFGLEFRGMEEFLFGTWLVLVERERIRELYVGF